MTYFDWLSSSASLILTHEKSDLAHTKGRPASLSGSVCPCVERFIIG